MIRTQEQLINLASFPVEYPMNTFPSQTSFVRDRRQKVMTIPKRKTVSILITTSELLDIKNHLGEADSLRITLDTSSLPPSFFKIFKHLRILDLRNVGLDVLPPQIVELENLEKLDLRYNNLTNLPSQITRLPKLHQLQLEDLRHRRTRLIKVLEDDGPEIDEFQCTCRIQHDGKKIPSMPTLSQLCMRTIISTLPSSAEDADSLSWQDLETFYHTGRFTNSNDTLLPFPSHLLPTRIPVDICSECSAVTVPPHAEFERMEVVALCRLRLRYVFCSHNCFSKVLRRWESDRLEWESRRLARQARFDTKDHSSIGNYSDTI